MAILSYNTKIFTYVNKWDENYSYAGIALTDKITQKNGQDYKLVDAIDIDWDGMWVQFANTYVYNTEQLLGVLAYLDPSERFNRMNNAIKAIQDTYVDITTLNEAISQMQVIFNAGDHIMIDDQHIISTYGLASADYVEANFPSYSYMYDYAYNKAATLAAIDEKISTLIGNADESFNTLKEISEWIMRQSEYVEVQYGDIDFSNGNRYYVLVGEEYTEVDKEYTSTHPSEQYYILQTVEKAMVDLSGRVSKLEDSLGTMTVDTWGQVSYTGALAEIHKLKVSYAAINSTVASMYNEMSALQDGLASATAIASEAKDMAENAAVTVSELSSEIGHASQEGFYYEISNAEARSMYLEGDPIYVKDTSGAYVQKNYTTAVEYTWYAYTECISSTGMHKTIESISDTVKSALYGLSIDNTDSMSYIYLTMTPAEYDGNSARTIHMHSKQPSISFDNGVIDDDGIVTATNVNTMISYVVDWVDI